MPEENAIGKDVEHGDSGASRLGFCLSSVPVERNKPIFWEWRGNHGSPNWPALGMRQGSWKLLTNHARGRTELYRIPEDPKESNNLVGKHPALVQRLLKKAESWRETLPENPPASCFSEAR